MNENFVKIITPFLFFFVLFSSCTGSQNQSPKIKFNLSEFTDNGLRRLPKGELTPINYEFCIPADEKILQDIRSIDTTACVYKGSRGRSGCTDKEWLVICSSYQPGFKKVITKLVKLKYIREINETFWEN